jgi:hypothetical protein
VQPQLVFGKREIKPGLLLRRCALELIKERPVDLLYIDAPSCTGSRALASSTSLMPLEKALRSRAVSVGLPLSNNGQLLGAYHVGACPHMHSELLTERSIFLGYCLFKLLLRGRAHGGSDEKGHIETVSYRHGKRQRQKE